MADWTCQPESPMNESQENVFINDIVNKINNEDKHILDRYELIKPLIIHKWVAIILKIRSKDPDTSRDKARRYYESMYCI